MSDSGSHLPPPSGGGSEPPPHPAGPTSAFPNVPDAEPSQPVVSPTEQMPTVPPTTGGGTAPPAQPPTGEIFPEGPGGGGRPWYANPGPIAVVVVVVLAIGGLLVWLLLRGDDDEPSADSSRLIIELTEESGQPIDRPLTATVDGPAGQEQAYQWLRPAGGAPGVPVEDRTGTDGRADFEWQVTEGVVDPALWAATVTVRDTLPAGWTLPGPTVDCALSRAVGGPETAVEMTLTPNDDIDGSVTYSFPGYRFVMGDTVTCELVFAVPGTETSTVPDSAPESTDATTTTSTTSTTSSTTSTTTTSTIPVVTVPPQPAATMWDVISNNADLSAIRDWIVAAGVQAEFQDADATMTLLAPSNQAIANAETTYPGIDFTDPDNLLLLVGSHLDDAGVLLYDDILDLDEMEVAEPGPHEIDASASPPVVCQLDCAGTPRAVFLVRDVETANGVIHVIDTVLLPVALAP